MIVTKEYIKSLIQEEAYKILVPIPNEERGIYNDFISKDDVVNVNEGIYKTYPPETTVRYIKQLFGIDDNLIRIVSREGNSPEEKRIQLIYYSGYGNIGKMKRAMMLCGYTLSKRQEHNEGYVEEIYIPLHLPNLNDIIRKYSFITHVTPSYYKDRILKNGFVPKSKNPMFSYPDRVFFFKGDTPMQEILYQTISFDSGLKNNRNDHMYTIFIIDVQKIPNNVNFHTDLTCPFGIYTNENVPPTCIKSYQDFNVAELENKYFK